MEKSNVERVASISIQYITSTFRPRIYQSLYSPACSALEFQIYSRPQISLVRHF